MRVKRGCMQIRHGWSASKIQSMGPHLPCGPLAAAARGQSLPMQFVDGAARLRQGRGQVPQAPLQAAWCVTCLSTALSQGSLRVGALHTPPSPHQKALGHGCVRAQGTRCRREVGAESSRTSGPSFGVTRAWCCAASAHARYLALRPGGPIASTVPLHPLALSLTPLARPPAFAPSASID